MDTRRKYLRKQQLLSIIIIVFYIASIYFIITGLYHEKKVFLNYKENNSINYKVYLKKNNFFEKDYLEEGKTYITSLIDRIHIDFKYNIQFDQPISGEYKYHVIATIEANKANNEIGNYWTKDYNITDEETVPLKIATDYEIKESVDIDYSKYNDKLNEFTKSVGLANTDGILKVYLVVDSNIKGKKIQTPIKKELMLKMPLSKLAIEASIENNAKDSISSISSTVRDVTAGYLVSTIAGFALLVISIVLSIIVIKDYKQFENENKIENKLSRFLNTYDSIIVNAETLPNIEDYNIIRVQSFEELIDAHSEVRMPINYYKKDDKNVFLLFNENNVWIYALNKVKKGDIINEE